MTDADASTLASVAIKPSKEQTRLLPWYHRLDQHRNLLLIVASCAQLLDIISIASVTIALPSLLRDVHYEQNQLQWVISSYALTYSAFLLVGGRMASYCMLKFTICLFVLFRFLLVTVSNIALV